VLNQLAGRYRSLMTAVKQLFSTDFATLTYAPAKLFIELISNLIEVYLLSNVAPLAGSLGAATAKFWSTLAQQGHDAKGIDFLTAITAAREAKDTPDQKNRRGN
jgi:hypothetical protein